MRCLLQALTAVGSGDFTVRLALEKDEGILPQLTQKFNELVERNEAMTR
ncbi:MAG: HAMP domain-containing protein [Candidatus Binataceae bacterium]